MRCFSQLQTTMDYILEKLLNSKCCSQSTKIGTWTHAVLNFFSINQAEKAEVAASVIVAYICWILKGEIHP